MLKFEHFVATGCISNVTGKECELSAANVKILLYIWQQLVLTGGPLGKTMDEIADYCGVSRKSVSRCVSDLVKYGILFIHEQTPKNLWYYGVERTVLKIPKIYGEDLILEEVKYDIENVKHSARRNKKDNGYYVYICKVDDKPVYVGKGVDDRLKHTTSGKSSNIRLNEAYFSVGPERMSVEVLRGGLDSDTAIEVEASTIRALLALGVDLYNSSIPASNYTQ